MSKYKKIKDMECNCCGSYVPVQEFSDDRSTQYLCRFCSNTVGGNNDVVTKAMMAQMFNVLSGDQKP